jgi:hypothetical protein
LERRAEHHLPLQLGQRREGGQGLAGGEPLLGLALGAVSANRQSQLNRVSRGPAEVADGDVVDDLIQPCAWVVDLAVAADRHPCLQQRLLKDVLGTGLGCREPPAVR